MRGVVGSGAGDDGGTVPHSLLDGAEHAKVFFVRKGGCFAGGPRDHQAVAAIVHKLGGQLRRLPVVHGAILGEGRDHGGQERTKGRNGGGCVRHGKNVTLSATG